MDPVLSVTSRKELCDALGEAQRIGMLGDEPVDAVIDRSLGFVRALPEATTTVIDLGSGGGDPGLVIATACPTARVTLVDRRAKRTDLLVRLVGRLGLSAQTEVLEADVVDLPRLWPGRTWDVATSRGFGPPRYTASLAADLLPVGGALLVSEPPSSHGERWTTAEVQAAGFELESVANGIARLIKKS